MFRQFCTFGLFLLFSVFSYANLKFEQNVISANLPVKTANFEFSFRFKNEGKTPITIIDIQTSCGCTVAKSDKKTYLPNENGEIKGMFSVGDRKGVQNKTIVLLTNNLGQSQIQLDLNLKIAQAIESSSNIIFWKIGKQFKEKEIKISIDSQYDFSRLVYDKNKFHIVSNANQNQKTANNEITLTVKPLDIKTPIRDTLKVVATATNKSEQTHNIFLIIK